jgi:hypothetical protein
LGGGEQSFGTAQSSNSLSINNSGMSHESSLEGLTTPACHPKAKSFFLNEKNTQM